MIKIILCLINLFFFFASESQDIKLKSFVTSMGFQDFKIGMTLNDFNKIEGSYALVNSDSLILGKEYFITQSLLGYKIDEIFYVFNNRKRLFKINWFFHDSKIKDSLVTSLLKNLGNPISVEKDDEDGEDRITWRQDSLSLVYHFNFVDKRIYVSFYNPYIPEDPNVFSLLKKYKKFLETKRSGRGNGTFNLTLSSLEKVVTGQMTLKKFESILPSWETNTFQKGITLIENKKTKIEDVPVFHLAYDFKLKNFYITANLKIQGDTDGIIKSIEIRYLADGESLAKFRGDLDLHGYYFDEFTTQVSYNFGENKDVYINKSKSTMALISSKGYGYSFEVRKITK
jgi:hypothetical protein